MVVPVDMQFPGDRTLTPKLLAQMVAIKPLIPDQTRFIKFMNRCLKYLRWVGAYPLEHKSGHTRLSPHFLAYNISLNVVFIPTTAYIAFSWDLSLMNTAIRCMNLFIFLFSMILFSFRLIRGVKQMGNIFQLIESAEKRLSRLGNFFTYGWPPVFFTLLTIICWLITISIKICYRGSRSYFLEFAAYYMELLHSLNIFGFTTLLSAVDVQLATVTDHLRWIINDPIHSKRKIETAEALVEVHEDLCTICYEISKFYSFQMLFTVTAGFISFVANAYFCVAGRDSFVTMSIHFFETLIGLLYGLVVCATSVSVCKKAMEFNTLLYQLMIDDKSNELSENKKLRLHINMKREVVFSACGFFNLDYTLIHSMVAAATTYLVILIQFGQPADSSLPVPNTTATVDPLYFTTPS